MKSYRFFHTSELACNCHKCDGDMDDDFMALIVALRLKCDFPFHLSSAYRCKEYNKLIVGSPQSAHMRGRAVDVIVSGAEARKLLGNLPDELTGVGAHQAGPYEERFIHLDNLAWSDTQPRPTFFTY